MKPGVPFGKKKMNMICLKIVQIDGPGHIQSQYNGFFAQQHQCSGAYGHGRMKRPFSGDI